MSGSVALGLSSRGLPTQPGPLVGREAELGAIRSALLQHDVRLLTLWGWPGIGKTRLALTVAAEPEVAATFVDGVVFVDLAPVSEPSAVMLSIANALGSSSPAAECALDNVVSQLRAARVLLVLDTLEHVLAMAPELAPLLVSCPLLKILVTSRAALRLRWERAFAVAPLAVPRAPFPRDAETAASYPGVAMFVERARAARPDFHLTDNNAAAVADVCARLDGVPLALELAASRLKGLPLLVLLACLESDRLQLLQAGAPDLPSRQQTLRRALAWSYDLLDAHHQMLFRRLGVFADGCTPTAAEAVCADPAYDLLEGLAALVHASLLHLEEPPEGQPRYTMLGTVLDYARERLAEDEAELNETRRRYAAYATADVANSRPAACPPAVVVNGYLEELTRREREVIELAVRGWSNRRIATELVISERTAEGHIHNILSKLQLESRAQLAAWGARVGLLVRDGQGPLLARS